MALKFLQFGVASSILFSILARGSSGRWGKVLSYLIGIDLFIGDDGDHWLPAGLINELHVRKVVVLSQVYQKCPDSNKACWLSANDLNLSTHWAHVWDGYIARLTFAGIQLNDSADILTKDGPC